MSSWSFRRLERGDHPWLKQFIQDRWGDEKVVVHQTIYYPAELPGWVVSGDDKNLGVLTYQINHPNFEIVTLDSLKEGIGIGTQLIQLARDEALKQGCQRLWLITTNDNLQALHFYQKRGFHLVALYPGAVDEARKIKPSIPVIAENGCPIRDELELELILR